MSCENGLARKDEVISLWEFNAQELRGACADVYRKSGVPVLYDLVWGEMWELVPQMRDAVRGSRVCVRVCVGPGVRVDRVASSE
jgi:hypothetical protein